MAVNKAKRSIHLAQPERRSPKSQPAAETMPVKAHVYRTVAELNGGFEKVIQDLKTLQHISFLRSASLEAMHDAICGIRARANQEFLHVLGERETANAGRFERVVHPRKPASAKPEHPTPW